MGRRVARACVPLRQLHASNFRRQCDKEQLWRVEYDYNWQAPPSKCCKGRGLH